MTATELGRTVASVLDRVVDGERVVVTRSRRAVAVIVGLEEGIEIMLAGSERFARLRREAREELESGLAEALVAWRAGIESP
ncbi:MAG: hypothetical protein QOI10_133 [Solirubrobacterales bacterium]|nr:hypothetical protein [Solirubrobacterales bacterium]